MLLRDTYPRRDYKGLIKRLMDYSKVRRGEVAELTAEAAEAIEELEDEVYDWKAYGKWERTRDGHFKCSVCHGEHNDPGAGIWHEVFDYRYKFCPNCGAMMEKE